jgi:chromate transporter
LPLRRWWDCSRKDDTKSIDYDRGALLLTSLCALIFIFTRTNPLIIVALAGLIGFLGWV